MRCERECPQAPTQSSSLTGNRSLKGENLHITFTLTVDDFFIKYCNEVDADHLLGTLKEQHVISEDWEAKIYCRVTLDWDYRKQTCILSMPHYVTDALKSFQHPTGVKVPHAPHPWVKPTFGPRTKTTHTTRRHIRASPSQRG